MGTRQPADGESKQWFRNERHLLPWVHQQHETEDANATQLQLARHVLDIQQEACMCLDQASMGTC
jgi:hypothetical protein